MRAFLLYSSSISSLFLLDSFSLSELLDSSVSGDTADPDQDGISNLLERAMYTDPRVKNTTDALTAQITNGFLIVCFGEGQGQVVADHRVEERPVVTVFAKSLPFAS